MTTSPHGPLDPLETDQPGEVTPLDPTTTYATGYDTGSTAGYDAASTSESSSTTDTAKNEAKNVKDAAADATSHVAGTAKEQAGQVVSDVRQQTRQLADQTRSQLTSQASDQQHKAVSQIRSVGDELRSLASGEGGQSGIVSQLSHEGADLTQKVADFIEQREPAELLDEVRRYARRKPGTFLIGAALAGVVVGRLTRGVVANRSDDSDSSGNRGNLGTGYAGVTPSSYLGTPVDGAPVGQVYTEETPAYGTAQMDQLAYPAEGADYTTESSYVADSGSYLPEEPGPRPAAQGRRPDPLRRRRAAQPGLRRRRPVRHGQPAGTRRRRPHAEGRRLHRATRAG
jgi:uncharacterized protein YjbJ (UPF0337 family)